MMKIIDRVYRVDDLGENAYLLTDEDVLIDSGSPGNAKKILEYMKTIGKKSSDLSKIILTHHHIDHIGSVPELKEKTNAQVVLHEKEAKILSGEITPTKGGLTGIFYKLLSQFYQSVPIEPEITVKKDDEVGGLKVVHTPGHTPGSISLYDERRKIMFVGDALVFSDGRIQKPMERSCWDFNRAGRSIEKLSGYDFEIMLSGHGKPLEGNASEEIEKFCRRNSPKVV